jgi:hypothetical protein
MHPPGPGPEQLKKNRSAMAKPPQHSGLDGGQGYPTVGAPTLLTGLALANISISGEEGGTGRVQLGPGEHQDCLRRGYQDLCHQEVRHCLSVVV